MTYQIQIIRGDRIKTAKNPLTMQPHKFDVREDAEHFALSMFHNARCDWKNEGRRLPKYLVVEAA